jgi:hypothetical protein
MIDQVTTKVCSKCRVEKGLESFTKKTGTKDGLEFQCRGCASVISKARYKANPEKEKERHALRYVSNLEKNREISLAYYYAHYEESRNKNIAYKKANYQAGIAKGREYTKKITDAYVAKLLKIKISQCPLELIELKRINILIIREIRNQQQCQN